MPKKATKRKTATKKVAKVEQPQVPMSKRLSDEEIALALSPGKANAQLRAVFQILDDTIEASLTQVATPELSAQAGIIAHVAGNYGSLRFLKEDIEDKIKASGDVLMGRVQTGTPDASY